MEIQLDPRGIRIRTKAGWLSFAPGDSVEQIIAALIEDRQGKAALPTDGLGTMRLGADKTDERTTAEKLYGGITPYKQGTAQGVWRKVPADPRLRRVVAKPPKAQRPAPTGMSLEELMS